MLSSLTKAHFFSVELFLQWSGLECLQPKVWVFVSASESGRLWSIFISVTFLFCNHLSLNSCPYLLYLVFTILAQKDVWEPRNSKWNRGIIYQLQKIGCSFCKNYFVLPIPIIKRCHSVHYPGNPDPPNPSLMRRPVFQEAFSIASSGIPSPQTPFSSD